MKIWRDCLRNTFMKGIADLMDLVAQGPRNCFGQVAYPAFNSQGMTRQHTLVATIGQYSQELLHLFRQQHISDEEGWDILQCVRQSTAYAGSDGSNQDVRGAGVHARCITDNKFLKAIGGCAPTVGSIREMSLLGAEHGGALEILLLLHGIYIHFIENLPSKLTVLIDNTEVVRRGSTKVPRLGIKQQLLLDYNLWATTEWLREALPCTLHWEWIKGHQT